jgi:calcineurin-like phosphoesterase family protein
MRLHLLSDLHYESEAFDPVPAPQADALVLAGDIAADWRGFERFAGWPVPVLLVAGNHEFDRREWNDAWPALRAHVQGLGLRLLERETIELTGRDGRRVRLLGTTRWADFDLYGVAQRERAMRGAGYILRQMRATRDGQPFDAAAMRTEALVCRQWLTDELTRSHTCDATVVITHFAPSTRSADPRFGLQPSTASFCNADDALISQADLWLHGHLHCSHDYTVPRADGTTARVVCNPRGIAVKGEGADFDPQCVLEV